MKNKKYNIFNFNTIIFHFLHQPNTPLRMNVVKNLIKMSYYCHVDVKNTIGISLSEVFDLNNAGESLQFSC